MEEHPKRAEAEAMVNGPASQTFTPRTPLAKHLWKLRQEVLDSGVPLLNLDEIRQEVQERRGGIRDEEDV